MSAKESTTTLGAVLKRWRVNEDLDLRSVAKEIGISAPSLMRIEHGHSFDAATMLKIWMWLLSARSNAAPRRRNET